MPPKKKGRKPKDWKPPYCQTLQIKKGNFILIFDVLCSHCNYPIKGDLKDFMH